MCPLLCVFRILAYSNVSMLSLIVSVMQCYNLGFLVSVMQVTRLPQHLRPSILGFGGLADGFLPFDTPSGEQVTLAHCSLVMKAVQARAQKLGDPPQASAVKLGDDESLSKAQVDPRLSKEQQKQVKVAAQAMAANTANLQEQHATAISQVLREAYCAVTRDRSLQTE